MSNLKLGQPNWLPQSILTSPPILASDDCSKAIATVIRELNGECAYSTPEQTAVAAFQIAKRSSRYWNASGLNVSMLSAVEIPMVIGITQGNKITYRSTVGARFSLMHMFESYMLGLVPTQSEWDQFAALVPTSVDLTGTNLQVLAATTVETCNSAAAQITRTVDADEGDEQVAIFGYQIRFDYAGASEPGQIIIGVERGSAPTAFSEIWAKLNVDLGANCLSATVFIPTIAQRYDRAGNRYLATPQQVALVGAGRYGAYFVGASGAVKLANAGITADIRVIPITQELLFSLLPVQTSPGSFFTR